MSARGLNILFGLIALTATLVALGYHLKDQGRLPAEVLVLLEGPPAAGDELLPRRSLTRFELDLNFADPRAALPCLRAAGEAGHASIRDNKVDVVVLSEADGCRVSQPEHLLGELTLVGRSRAGLAGSPEEAACELDLVLELKRGRERVPGRRQHFVGRGANPTTACRDAVNQLDQRLVEIISGS
jgi:hypothetical protein